MTDTPTLWRDMTPEEKGALLLAEHEGKVIEVFGLAYPDEWYEDDPCFDDDCAYRIRPELETVTAKLCVDEFGTSWLMEPHFTKPYEGWCHYFTLTFNIIDGKPDPASIKIEEL